MSVPVPLPKPFREMWRHERRAYFAAAVTNGVLEHIQARPGIQHVAEDFGVDLQTATVIRESISRYAEMEPAARRLLVDDPRI